VVARLRSDLRPHAGRLHTSAIDGGSYRVAKREDRMTAQEPLMRQPLPFGALPRYASINVWCELSGLGRTSTYAAIRRGELRAKKFGKKTLIDLQQGLEWLASLPDIKPVKDAMKLLVVVLAALSLTACS
jgi:hypothetical protein